MAFKPLAETILRDVRHALRGIRTDPLVAIALVSTLGLGIGASTALFSVVDALILRPLPYGEPEELVQVLAGRPDSERAGHYIPRELARDWLENAEFLEAGMLHVRKSALYTGGGIPRTVALQAATPEFEQVVRVRPALGRGISASDAQPGSEPVAVLSHSFWRAAFGGDPGAVGEYVEFDRITYRVVGVMPEDFKFPMYATTAAWVPLREDGTVAAWDAVRVNFLGRVAEMNLDAARARAEAMAAGVAERYPPDEQRRIELQLLEAQRGSQGLTRAVGFLSGAVGLILLIAFINSMGLLLVRGWARARELAVRVALGASRSRLLGQLVTESAVLALISGLAAVALAILIMHAIRGIMPGEITFFSPFAIEIDGRSLFFAFAVAVGAGLLVGLVPAIRATGLARAAARAGLTPYASTTAGKSRLRRGLVIGEVAISVMLLIGAGLLIGSVVRLMRVDPGFRIEELAVMDLSLTAATYASPEAQSSFMTRLERRLEAIPGVAGVAVSTGGLHVGTALQAEGSPNPAGRQPYIVSFRSVRADFFPVMEIPILAGRAFLPGDAAADRAIIDRDLARFLWGDMDPAGRRFRTSSNGAWHTVVGLIGDLQLSGPDDRGGDFEILYPLPPDPAAPTATFNIRTRGDPVALFEQVRNAVYTLNPEQPIWHIRTAKAAYVDNVAMSRFLMVVMTLLAALALLLASVGVHGMLAFEVTQRRRELGVRMALGARPAALARAVLREGVALAAAGSVVGLAGALALSRIISSLLYGVAPTDPATLAVVVGVALSAAAVACYWPARRATRVDPMEVIRCE